MFSAAPPLRLYRRDGRAAGAALFLVAIRATLTLIDVYGAKFMKRLLTAVCLLGLTLTLPACQSMGGLEGFVKAANELDPDCYKDVDIKITPMLLLGWAVPVPSGSYRKVCNPPAALVGLLAPGSAAAPVQALAPPLGAYVRP